ncbi:MAG: SGNH/GDSL hydrolase family protein [Deltaproteobacteria bacterium]|nr:SGNH/GDSL hydrolase family protein [Deltaproteobacteria bacterium]
MKKIIFLFILGLSLGGLYGNGPPAEAQGLFLPSVFNAYCPNPQLSFNFLAFGDSITGCYYDSYYLTDFPNCGYEKRIYDRLQQEFGYCQDKLAFFNKSEGGETTSGGLLRFYDTITFPTRNNPRLYPTTATATVPDLVIIMEGTNDMNVGIPDVTIAENLRTMIDIAFGQGKQVILATIPPAFGADEVERQARIQQFNPTIFQIGLEKGIPIADVYGRLAGHPEWAAADGLHFNDAGFDQMADVFYQVLVPLLGLGN